MFYSFKYLNHRWDNALTSAEKNALRMMRDIITIATRGGVLKRVSDKTYSRAKKAYNAFKRLNRLNDRLLVLDNDADRYNSRFTRLLHDEADKLDARVNSLLKGFKLSICYYGAYASIVDADGRTIGLNYVL